MIDGKENNFKKKNDEMLYYKGQCEILREEIGKINLMKEKFMDQCNLLEGENSLIKKDK
jgi:hypothetical protein